MPIGPPTRCRYCGSRGRAVCPKCQAKVDADKLARLKAENVGRPASGRRGYDAEWRRLSKEARERQPWCTFCGATENLTGDHIDPTKRTDLTLDDVQVLCQPCNTAKGG